MCNDKPAITYFCTATNFGEHLYMYTLVSVHLYLYSDLLSLDYCFMLLIFFQVFSLSIEMVCYDLPRK